MKSNFSLDKIIANVEKFHSIIDSLRRFGNTVYFYYKFFLFFFTRLKWGQLKNLFAWDSFDTGSGKHWP